MKTSEVKVGESYLCRIGDRVGTVVVTAKVTGGMRSSGRKEPDRFRVRRVGAHADLPSARSAAALRPIPEASTKTARSALVNTLEGLSKLEGDTLDALCKDNQVLTHEPYEDKAAKHLDTQPCIRCNTALDPNWKVCHCGHPLSDHTTHGCLTVDCSCGEFHNNHFPARSTLSDLLQGGSRNTIEEDCPALPHEPATERDLDGLPSYDTHTATAAGEKAYTEAIASGCTPDEADRKAVEAYDKVSIATDGHATPVSQEFYLSAAENKVGWCTNCQAFRGTDIEADSRELECPDCHKHTLYGAELALRGWLIAPIEDDAPAKPFWRCESCGHEDHERTMPPDRQAFYAGNRPKWLTVCPRCKSDDFTPVGY